MSIFFTWKYCLQITKTRCEYIQIANVNMIWISFEFGFIVCGYNNRIDIWPLDHVCLLWYDGIVINHMLIASWEQEMHLKKRFDYNLMSNYMIYPKIYDNALSNDDNKPEIQFWTKLLNNLQKMVSKFWIWQWHRPRSCQVFFSFKAVL